MPTARRPRSPPRLRNISDALRSRICIVRGNKRLTPSLFLPLAGGGKNLLHARRFAARNAVAACSSLPLKGGGIGWGSRINIALSLTTFVATTAVAQTQTVEQFYKGRTVNLIVGF